jgi:hypothetical protein
MASGGYFARMVGDQFDMLESLVRGGGRADARSAVPASGPETIAPLVSYHSGA